MPTEMSKEIWKEIQWTDGSYLVSSEGRVKSLPREVKFGNRVRRTKEVILKCHNHRNGYSYVNIFGKHEYVHRLVADAFLPKQDGLKEVNHKDENKKNNKADNLEWCNGKHNVNYGTGLERAVQKRMARYVVQNIDTGETYRNPLEAYKQTGVHNDSISRVCRGKSKTAGGYRWRYIEDGFCAS